MTQSAKAALASFLRQMCDWEVKYAALNESLGDDFEAWQSMRQEAQYARRQILQAYCDARLLRDEVLDACDFQTPSCYDPDRDLISEAEFGGELAVFDYQQTVGLKSRFRFTLTQNGARWIISKAEWGRNFPAGLSWEPLFI